MNDIVRHKVKHNLNRIKISIKWVVFSIISGIVVGTAGTLFYFSMSFVTKLRGNYPWILYFLPIGGLLIVGAYRMMHDENDTGTNLVLSAIHSGDHLPLRMAPLIFMVLV